MADPKPTWTAVNPKTGERIALVGGQWAPATGNVARGSTNDQEQLTKEREKYNKASNLASLANQFVQRNYDTGTGGIGTQILNDDGWIGNLARDVSRMVNPKAVNDISEMRAIQQRTLQSMIQPGTSGVYNTATEQQMALSAFPSVKNFGPVNGQIARQLNLDLELQRQRFMLMDRWLKTRGTLAGFEEFWAPRADKIRQTWVWQKPPTRAQQRNAAAGAAPANEVVIDLQGNRIR